MSKFSDLCVKHQRAGGLPVSSDGSLAQDRVYSNLDPR